MRKGYAPKTRRLAFQQLESRQLLAIFTSQWGGRIEVVMDPSVPWVTHEHAGGPTHNIMVRVLPTVGGTVHNAPVTIVFGDDAGGGEAAFAPPAVTFQALDTGWANVTLSGKDDSPDDDDGNKVYNLKFTTHASSHVFWLGINGTQGPFTKDDDLQADNEDEYLFPEREVGGAGYLLNVCDNDQDLGGNNSWLIKHSGTSLTLGPGTLALPFLSVIPAESG